MVDASSADAIGASARTDVADGVRPGGRHPVGGVRRLGALLVLVAIASVAISFAIVLGLTPIVPEGGVLTVVTVVNASLAALIALFVWREVRTLLKARQKGRVAARLHIRIVGLFGVVAAAPAILVALVAGITLDEGLDRLFDTRTNEIVESSVSVARSYIGQSAFTAQGTTVNMAQNLSSQGLRRVFSLDRMRFVQFMQSMTRARGLVAAQLIEDDGTVLETVTSTPNVIVPRVPPDALETMRERQVAIIQPDQSNIMGVLVQMPELRPGLALHTVKLVDPQVLKSIDLMREKQAEYDRLRANRIPTQLALATLYVSLCLIVLLAATWAGIGVADRIITPIRRLIGASDRVRQGDLAVQVAPSRSEGDLRSLTQTFNAMVRDLRTQRDEILETQAQSDARRRFTEAVLSGVSTGVVGVTSQGRISIANSFAATVLGVDADAMHGCRLEELAPELSEVLQSQEAQQIVIQRNGVERTLLVQVTAEATGDGAHASVVTLDDITDLIAAQRTSAWADVARRIAHEIKNPLTPIQLSAERIKRRYGKRITEDREVFDQCLETIVRQVGDIGRMVDEFSSFARMPKPVMVVADLVDTVREAVFLRRVGAPDVTFKTDLPDTGLVARFDDRMIGQAVGNLVKNAAEAMEGVEMGEDEVGTVLVVGRHVEGFVQIDVIDNGRGLPVEDRQRLLEPYMTTREKGTGLGLAIVGKIIEEHGGRIELLDADLVIPGQRGALIRIVLPAVEPEDTQTTQWENT